jgi:GGDEF domain-containing protein
VEMSRAATGKAGGVRFVVGQIRAERLRFLLMRLSFVGVVLLNLGITAWALPGLPWGMEAEDYTPATFVLMIMAFASAVATLLFTLVWAPQFRDEPLPEFLRVLFGAGQLIRGPQQFRSRLVAECRRARKDRRQVFSLIVVQFPNGEAAEEQRPLLNETENVRQYAAMVVRNTIRAEDVVGDSWPREVWVLSAGAPQEARPSIMHRLARSLASTDDGASFAGCRIGGSTFGRDGDQPNEIFSAAYERLAPLSDVVQPEDETRATDLRADA